MSRPSSASRTGLRPSLRPRSRPASGQRSGDTKGNISYEDLLVAQYLEELKKSSSQFMRADKPNPTDSTSPYIQRLSHTHVVPTPSFGGRQRPLSASAKPKIDAKFIDDTTLWDPATPRLSVERRSSRPASAPVQNKRSAISQVYGGRRPSSAKSVSYRRRALYKKQPSVVVVTAFINGQRDIYAHLAAPNLKLLLEMATDRLELNTAARRLFLTDGSEVFSERDISREAEVYVSMGEGFKDPYKGVRKHAKMLNSATWTVNGVVLSQDCRKKTTKTLLSKRFSNLIAQSRRRILVYRNGHGAEGAEIVASPHRLEDFLVACTAKLDMGSHARVLYNWEGAVVQQLDEAPVMDLCLQRWSTPVLGPLWVSRGEGFSPKGVIEFLTGIISYTKSKLKEAQNYQAQLQDAQHEETKGRVDIVAILSMSETELEETLDIVQKDIDDFSNALNRLKQQMDKIKSSYYDEQEVGVEYTMKHIDKLEADNKLLGMKGLRLKVYENGTYEDDTTVFFNLQQGMRGMENNPKQVMTRLLDECSSCTALANPKTNPTLWPNARCLYNAQGQTIESIHQLETDQEVWIAFGEPWKNPFTYVLCAQFDKVRVFDFVGERRMASREQLPSEDTDGKDNAHWNVVEGVPDEFPATTIGDDYEKAMVMPIAQSNEISLQSHFLKSKDNKGLMLYPEIVVNTKKKGVNKDIWPSTAQIWVVSKGGYIYNKAMPQLVVSVSDKPFSGTSRQHAVELNGFVVSLLGKQPGNPSQKWVFTADGLICAQSQPQLALTFLGSHQGEEEGQVTNTQAGTIKGEQFFLAVCQKLSGKEAALQRWALKQEKVGNLGQWKYTRVENPEWNKKAYSWPSDENGELNEDYDWPMEGYFIPNAPPLKKTDKRNAITHVPMRLLVLKNGMRNVNKAICVVGPDLGNMKKDVQCSEDKKKNKKKMKKKQQHDSEVDSIVMDTHLHCNDQLTILQLEFTMFLERATSLLELPFAARRLFDCDGREHFNLQDLHRDQIVYVTCGEQWANPSVSKAEQQRRHLLTNLSDDVAQIEQFVRLRKASNLVLEVEGPLAAGSRIAIGELYSRPMEDAAPVEASTENGMLEVVAEVEEDEEVVVGNMTAHEQAHRRAEERLNQLKWPWERIVNGGFEENPDPDGEQERFTNKELYQKYRARPRRPVDMLAAAQKFVFDSDGFIVCSAQPHLVLGVETTEGRAAQVVLAKRRIDDITQRWIVHDNGLIQAKHRLQMVLTVSLPSGCDKAELSVMDYRGSHVTLQQCKTTQFGRANQRWSFDASNGTIQAFYTDETDKEVTAANRANVCTYAVIGDLEIDQPGYVVEMPTTKAAGGEKSGGGTKKLLICSSCARAMRGRHKLEKVKDNVDFSCAMGTVEELGVKQVGSFRCLNGKVDLSTFEAEHTLLFWQQHLEQLRAELSVRAVARSISAARVPFTLRVLAYRNGDGRRHSPETIIGSSVAGILQQATHRLQLPSAARRIYTCDGVTILDLDDLVAWAQGQYVRQAQQQMRTDAKKAAELRRENEATGAAPSGEGLIDKVWLDSSGESSADSADEKAGDEEEEEEKNGTVNPDTVVMFGYEATEQRHHLDKWRNCIVVPTPSEVISVNGHIVTWNFFAFKPGVIYLQVFRAEKNDRTSLLLTAQLAHEVKVGGAHSIDVSSSPIEVNEGDLVGFYCPDESLVTYDVVDNGYEVPYVALPKVPPAVGQMLKMDTVQRAGSRQYSLNVVVYPDQKSSQNGSHKKDETSKNRKKTPSGQLKKKKKKRKLPHIEPPPVEMMLRYPIEVWVSMGELFSKPEEVLNDFEAGQRERSERAGVSLELEKEKHVLRQLHGRRLGALNPGAYRSTLCPQRPVLVEGHWQEESVGEQRRQQTVQELQNHLSEVKESQRLKQAKVCNAKTTRRLYTNPTVKRVLVYPNGASMQKAVFVWGESLDQLLHNSTARLGLRKDVQALYTPEGHMVRSFDEVERDCVLCAATGKNFLPPEEGHHQVTMKANWGRARRQYGPGATEILVTSNKNSTIEVDPFGRSALAGGSSSK